MSWEPEEKGQLKNKDKDSGTGAPTHRRFPPCDPDTSPIAEVITRNTYVGRPMRAAVEKKKRRKERREWMKQCRLAEKAGDPRPRAPAWMGIRDLPPDLPRRVDDRPLLAPGQAAELDDDVKPKFELFDNHQQQSGQPQGVGAAAPGAAGGSFFQVDETGNVQLATAPQVNAVQQKQETLRRGRPEVVVVHAKDPLAEPRRPTTSSSYRPRVSSNKWTDQDTLKFYKAIQMFGTDFSLIERLFPMRTRRQIKNKFKREERVNPKQLDQAIKTRLPIDREWYFGAVAEEKRLMEEAELSRKKKEEAMRREHQLLTQLNYNRVQDDGRGGAGVKVEKKEQGMGGERKKQPAKKGKVAAKRKRKPPAAPSRPRGRPRIARLHASSGDEWVDGDDDSDEASSDDESSSSDSNDDDDDDDSEPEASFSSSDEDEF